MPKKYLVTGGNGFIGSALVSELARRGNSVRSFDNHWRNSGNPITEKQNVEFVTGDIRDAEAVTRAVQGVDCVCHLAAINGTEFFYSHPDLVLDVSVRGMMNVLDACERTNVREVLITSSSEVYQTPPQVPTAEDAPLSIPDPWNPRYSYAGGKIISELLTIHCGKNLTRRQIIRPHNVYGAGMGHQHVIPQLIERIASGNKAQKHLPLVLRGDGEETRAFVYISDFIDGMLTVLEKGDPVGIFHVGNPEEVKISDLARAIGECMGFSIDVKAGEAHAGSTSRRCPDISKLRALGFNPRIPLVEGLRHTIPFYVDRLKNDLRKSDDHHTR